MGAGKSRFRIARTQSKEVCTKTAMNRLPFVLLKTHVMTMVKAIAAMTNITMLRMVGGKFQAGTQNMGRCHNAQRGPRIRLPTKGPCSRCKAGQRESAPPRLFAQRSSQEKYVNKENEQGQWGQGSEALKRCRGPRQEDHAEHHDRRDADEGEQVPPKAHPPQHQPAQQAAYPLPPFGYARHDERR